LYGKPNDTLLDETKKRYNWIAPKLFHLTGEQTSATSRRQAGKAHACTVLSNSYTVGMLAKKMYIGDSTSELFQKNRDPASTRYKFEQALNELTAINPEERSTIVHVINILKGKPYYMEEPSMCYR
jgi:hypothetical protein